jgi:uncharacterized protein (TIGR02265 family)
MARTKGTHVINAVKVLKQDRARALKHLPPHLHKYLEQRIMPSSWYPLEEHLGLLRAIAELFMPPGVDPWMAMGRGTARLDLTGNGPYKLLLWPGDPGRTLSGIMALWRSVHDSGEVYVATDGPRQATVTLRDYAMHAREICAVLDGYLAEAATLAGGRDVRVNHVSCLCRDGGECLWRVTWG